MTGLMNSFRRERIEEIQKRIDAGDLSEAEKSALLAEKDELLQASRDSDRIADVLRDL